MNPPSWLNPMHPPLEGREAINAAEDLVVARPYTQMVRSQIDIPVPQQNYGLVSFMLFNEPKKLPSGKPVYGFLKLRGNYTDVNLCKNRAADIVRTQDSKNKVLIMPVGSWLPITADDGVVGENVDVNIDVDAEYEKKRQEAAMEKEKEEQRIARELKEREQEVKTSKDYNDDTTHIDYYTLKRVAWMRILEREAVIKKDLEKIQKVKSETRKTLVDLDSKFPKYATQWIDNYNTERRKSGIPDYIPSAESEKEYALAAKDL